MVDRDDRQLGDRGTGDVSDIAAPTGVGGVLPGTGALGGGLGVGGLGGVADDADASGATGDEGTKAPGEALDKGGRIGDDQNASAGAAGAAVGNQRGAVGQR